jgi:hypothetical protein
MKKKKETKYDLYIGKNNNQPKRGHMLSEARLDRRIQSSYNCCVQKPNANDPQSKGM